MRGVYRGTVPPRAAAPLRRCERNRTGGAHRRAVFRRQHADLVLDRRHAARLRLHVPDDSVRRRHRQTRRTVHHGARVRTGRTGGVAALADRYVHWRARRIRRLRLACDRAGMPSYCSLPPTHCVSAWHGWWNAAISAKPHPRYRPPPRQPRRWPSPSSPSP